MVGFVCMVILYAFVGAILGLPLLAALALLAGMLRLPLPVRATRPTHTREPIPMALRTAVLDRDGWRCVQCGSQEELQLDHIIPYSRGGATTYENLQVLCGHCNREKGSK